MDVLKLLASLMSLLTEPGGKAMLEKIFVDHNMSVASVKKIVDDLKEPPPLKPITGVLNLDLANLKREGD